MTRVIVVDERDEGCASLRALLGRHGIAVDRVASGAEALAHARREPPDLVLAKLPGPDLDGFPLLLQWKADPGLTGTPFVILATGHVPSRDEARARELGADDFIVEPAPPEAFVRRLLAVLDRARKDRPGAPSVPDHSTAQAAHVLAEKLAHKAQQLERANRQLRDRERLYRALFLSNPHPMWVYDTDTLRFLAVNDAAVAHYGYSHDEFLAMTIADIRPAEDLPRLLSNVAQVRKGIFDHAGVWRHRRRDGSLIDVEITSHLINYLGTRAEVVAAHDVTARLKAERALARRNRLYAMLSHTNELLLRATDRQALLDGVCRVAVEHGGFLFAWLGLLDDARCVHVVARAGEDRGYVDELQLQLNGSPDQAGGPTTRALITGRHVFSNDFLAEPANALRHEAAARVGVRASAAFPLRVNGAVVGSLSLYADEVGFFGSDELETLDEMAADVGFGLENQERNELLRAASQVVEASPVVLFRWRTCTGWPIEFVTSNIARWGYTAEECVATERPFCGLIHADDVERVVAETEQSLRSGVRDLAHVFRIVTHAGELRWVECNISQADGMPDRVQATVSDVTERERAAQALRQGEQTLRQVMDTLHVGVWLIDRDGRIVTGNRAGKRIWAGARYVGIEEFGEYRGWWADTGQPIGPHDWAAARAIERGETSIDEVVDIQCFDGTRKTILNSAVPLRDEDGAIRSVIVVNHDITERRVAEIALAASERQFRATFDHAAVGVAHIGPDGRWREVNHRLCEIVDYSREELLAMSFQDITHPEDVDRDVGLAAQLLAGERRTYAIEKRYIRKDRAVVWVNLTAALVRTTEGRADYFVTVVEDITARRRAEDELRKLSQAVEQAAESLVITDARGSIEYVNEAFTVVSGYSRDELIGRNPRVLQSGRTPPETYDRMWATLTAGAPWSGEFINRRKDGTEYTEAVNVSPVRQPDGTITHYVAVKEDVSERRRTEQELERYRHELEALVQQRTAQLGEALTQAEAANEAKSAFLANMSHEIRTPMNGVLGMLEILERSRLTGQQADLVHVARDSGRTLLGIIDDILDLSKIEAGRIQIVTDQVELTDLVEGLCDSLLPVAARKGVELAVFVDPALPERVLTDPLRLRQILFNLLGNAIKFSGDRPEVAGRVVLRVTRGERGDGAFLPLAVSVADNGIGMTADETSRLFQPFTQAEATTTRRYGGTGLGLTICRRLADLMGGCIDVTSARGAGTTFTLSIPVEVAASQPVVERPDLSGLDVLLVESPTLDVDAQEAWLVAAGARVERRPAASVRPARLSGPGPQIEIRHLGHAAVSQDQIKHWPGPCLLITGGRRRRLRPEAPGVVSLDSAALRRGEFLRAVAVAAGRLTIDQRSAAAAAAAGDVAPALPVHEARARGELILVAEDDEVNRKVIGRQLELLGRTAQIAHDGAEALRLWREGGYALVLTDLHMPELDGYALTRAIRADEAGSDRPPTPILALTANAMRGEAEQARTIGMNDYLIKPLQLDHLQKAIDRWMPASPAAAPASPVFDPEMLRSFVGDDTSAVRELLQLYLETSPLDGQEFQKACAANDADAAGRIAHKLKSSARSVGALRLSRLCEQLERAGRGGDLGAVLARADEFDAAVRAAAAAIAAWLAELR